MTVTDYRLKHMNCYLVYVDLHEREREYTSKFKDQRPIQAVKTK